MHPNPCMQVGRYGIAALKGKLTSLTRVNWWEDREGDVPIMIDNIKHLPHAWDRVILEHKH